MHHNVARTAQITDDFRSLVSTSANADKITYRHTRKVAVVKVVTIRIRNWNIAPSKAVIHARDQTWCAIKTGNPCSQIPQ